MNIKCLTVGEFQENCYLLWESPEATIVVDPGAEADRIEAFLKEKGLHPILYLMTHGHMDHVSALADIQQLFPAPIAMHEADAKWAFTEANSWPPFYPTPKNPGPIAISLAEGQTFTHGGMTYKVIETPGHSPGSVSFIFEQDQVMVSGDTLFNQGVGRTDLPYADPEVFQNTLSRLITLPDELTVLPGHGPATSIGSEKQLNPFLLELIARS